MEDSLELLEDIEEVAEQFFICTRAVRRFVDLFLNTGDVTTEHRKPGPSQCNGFSGDFCYVQMRLMLASRLPSYGSMIKLCTYPLTCVFICVQVHWLEIQLNS